MSKIIDTGEAVRVLLERVNSTGEKIVELHVDTLEANAILLDDNNDQYEVEYNSELNEFE